MKETRSICAIAITLLVGMSPNDVRADTSVIVSEGPSGTWTASVTTDAIFDTIVVTASGDVGNEVNVAPPFLSEDGVLLTTPGAGWSYATGFGDIELTYFATQNWTAGFSGQDFLQVDLFSGVGDATVYLLDNGPVIEQASIMFSPSAGQLGDFNNDGSVDAADYTVWRDNFNGGSALPNDNGLGTPIGSEHYKLWRGNFGAGASPVASGATSAPEPTALGLALIILSASYGSRFRGRA